MAIPMCVIPVGATLYHTSDNAEEFMKKPLVTSRTRCQYTGKIGIRFSTYPLMALAKCSEHSKDMTVITFKTTRDIVVSRGMYGFRDLNPSRYRTESGNWIPNIEAFPEENVGHFDSSSKPLVRLRNGDLIDIDVREVSHVGGDLHGELYLTSEDDLLALRRTKNGWFNVNYRRFDNIIRAFRRKENIPLDLNSYKGARSAF
jgi:hypothetical protein